MAYQLHSQHLDTASGFHVIELRDEKGNKHIVQIAVGHDSCPTCGVVYPKDNLGTVDPKARVTEVVSSLNKSSESVADYAAKHGLNVK